MFYLRANLLLVFVLVLILSVLPLPDGVALFRPAFGLLFLLYLQFMIPKRPGIPFIFLLGICLDVLLSTVLGEHIFALLLLVWLASFKVRQFHFFPISQQLLVIVLFSMVYQCTLFTIDLALGYQYAPLQILGTTFMNVLLWPWWCFLMNHTFNLSRPLYIK